MRHPFSIVRRNRQKQEDLNLRELCPHVSADSSPDASDRKPTGAVSRFRFSKIAAESLCKMATAPPPVPMVAGEGRAGGCPRAGVSS